MAVAPSPHRASLSRILRIVVAVALTAYILRKAHPGEVLRVTGGADWRWIVAALGLLFVDRTLMAYRWTVLLCALTPGSRPPFNAVLRIFFVSTFVGTFLPGVGGDLYRAYSLSRLDVSGVESAASVLMDRVLGVMAIVIIGVAALVPAPAAARNTGMVVTLVLASFGCLVGGIAVFSERAASLAQRLAGAVANARVRRIGLGMIASVRRYSHHHRELVNVLFMSVGVQIIRVVQAWCLGRALGIDVGIAMYFILIPIVLLIMLLPVTVSGLGTSQGAFVWLFGAIGVPVAAAVALSILFVTLGIVGNLPGGLLYVFGSQRGTADGVKIAAAVLAGSVAVLSWLFGGGVPGLLYLLVYLLAVAPGFPIGFALFGRSHPAAWVCGALIGYGITQLSLWTVIVSGLASPVAFLGAWSIVTAGSWALWSRQHGGPAIAAYTWSAADTRALLLVLLIVPALMAPPYRNIGRADATGTRYYRAYFTADFLWHTALASELGKFSLPPRNPYLAPRVMNYYWTYFLLPSAVASAGPAPLRDVQACLKTNAFYTALLMVGALFLLVRTSVASAGPAAAAVLLAVLAASVEGLYAIIDLVSRGRPLEALTDMNIDAITAWKYGGLRIDDIPRSLWYTPQHTTSLALGLVGLVVASTAGARASMVAIAAAGLALGLATTINPLLGAVCSIIYGVAVGADAVTERNGWRLLPRHAVAAVPVVLAVAWGAASKVVEGAGSALQFGFAGFSRNHPVLTLLLSVGPLLIPALPGVWPVRSQNVRAWAIGTSGLVVALTMLYLVRISEASWVGFRAGQLILVSLPMLLAPVLARLNSSRRLVLAAVILIAGFPTTAIDAWNAQDIGNRRPGPGFRWTIWTTPEQQQAFAWIKANTPATAIVQMEPVVRGREHWTLIPSFAGRRMAAGLPISLLPLPEYQERSDRVKAIFSTSDAPAAADAARRLRIDYLYVDETDIAAYAEGTRKFDEQPALFERVYANPSVRIYKVR